MKVLVCNVGSTSLKFKLYDMPESTVLAQCGVERVGSDHNAVFRYEQIATGKKASFEKADIPSYESGIRMFLDYLTGAEYGVISTVTEIERVGYKAISCHLGGSCSVCAIENGKSVDTSFGMSLESGLIHANRVGDMDASMSYFLRDEGLSDAEILEGLQKKGGLLGISGVSNDLRYVIEAAQSGSERAQLAVDVFVTGVVHYIGAFAMDLGGLDYLVFTAGIGEHSDYIRARVCDKLGLLGVKLDAEKNAAGDEEISAPDSAVRVLVIPTNEELGIARRTYEYQ